jgi:hypothetical protein
LGDWNPATCFPPFAVIREIEMDKYFLAALAEIGNKHVQRLNDLPPDEGIAEMERIVRSAPIAFTIWPHEGSHFLEGAILIKGGNAGRRMVRRGRLRGHVAVLPCPHRFLAEAVNDAFGDGTTVLMENALPPPEVVPHLAKVVQQAKAEAAALDEWIEQANLNGDLVRDRVVTVKQLFEAAEVVQGIWSDPTRPNGIGRTLLKGHATLVLNVQADMTSTIVNLRFADARQAMLASALYGDGRAQFDKIGPE